MSVNPWIKKLGRVAGMSPDEVRVRTAQEFAKRWDLARSKMPMFSFAERRPVAFGGRGKFFFSRDEVPGILAWLGAHMPAALDQIVADADRILDHRFDLLGYQDLDYGKEIDWHFDAVHRKSAPRVPWFRVPYLDFDQVGDHKVIWELSRHQHLLTLAKAYLLTERTCYAEELFRQWYQWQDQNPYPVGINWASSLEVAFRSLSWLWVWHLLEGQPVVPGRFAFDLQRALMQNARHIERYLSTYFAPNTHLLGEAVALFFIGSLAPASSAVRRWQRIGWSIILREAGRQVHPDGMHFEQSIYYHVYALDLFLHARILAAANGVPIPRELDATTEKMLEALSTLSRTGPLPQFGDDDGGRVFDPRRNHRIHMLDPLATGSIVYRRADFKRAAAGPREEMLWLLGADAARTLEALREPQSAAASVALSASGIYVMSSNGSSQQQLVIDAGRQGPGWAGHGHADALSVQLSSSGKHILVDPGTFTYVAAAGERARFRETACHNTVQVDGVSQAEPTGPFKWVGLANATVERWLTGEGFDLFVGSHAGYGRLSSPVIHRRHVFYLKPHFWLVRDVLQGAGIHQLDVSWSFAPGSLFPVPGGVRFLGYDNAVLTAMFASHASFKHEFLQGWFSPRYGAKEPSPLFRVSAKSSLPVECATVLIPEFEKHPEFAPIAVSDASGVHGYRLSMNHRTHEIYFSDVPQKWTAGPLASDARFAYRALSDDGRTEHVAACDGTFLDLSGKRLIASEAPITACELHACPAEPDAGRSKSFLIEHSVWDDSAVRFTVSRPSSN